MSINTIETRTGKAWLGENGILYVQPFAGVDLTLSGAQENMAVVSRLTQGEKIPMFLDLRSGKSITREARNYYVAQSTISALAMRVNSHLSMMIANIFIGFSTPTYPVKLFTSESEAIKWLKDFLGEE